MISSSLLESKIGWTGQIIVKNIVIKLQFTIHLKKFRLAVLKKSFFQLLHVDISKFTVNFWVIYINAIKPHIFKHFLVSLKFLLWRDVDMSPFEFI